MSYEAVIGLEIHAQLQTATKIFCGCSTSFGAPANANVCPVCLGLSGCAAGPEPGSGGPGDPRVACRPDVPSQRDVDLRAQELLLPGPAEGLPDLAVRAAACRRRAGASSPGRTAAGGCGLRASTWKRTRASRCTKALSIRIARPTWITTAPARRSSRSSPSPTCDRPSDAAAFFEHLRAILVWLGVNDGNMEEGSLRCDANVSVRPAGTDGAWHEGGGEEPQLVPFPAEGARVRDRAAGRPPAKMAGGSGRRRGCSTRPPESPCRCAARRRRTTIATSPIPTCRRSWWTRRECDAIRAHMPELPSVRRRASWPTTVCPSTTRRS